MLQNWFAVFLMISSGDCANILIFNLAPLFSHQIGLREIWLELARRGHNVTIVCTHTSHESELESYREILIPDLFGIVDTTVNKRMDPTSIWQAWGIYFEGICDFLTSTTLSQPRVQEWIHNSKSYHFDVIITEMWFPELLVFSRIFNCPSVGFVTIWDTHLSTHYQLGNPVSTASSTDINLPYAYDLTFEERFWSFLFTIWELYKEYFVYMPQQQGNLDRFVGNITDVKIGELKMEMDLLLINANEVLTTVKAVGPTTLFVGGGNHIKPLKRLPQDLETYLDAAEEGFIYMSLGSNLKSTDLEEHVLGVLIEVMGKLPYKILWKFEAETLPQKMDNVKIVQWAPQQDVLRHPNIKLFISQGGVQSLEEAVFSGVPVLIMPFFGDQYKNGQLAVSKGFGKMILHRPRLNKYELESSILELINNQKYKNTAIRLAKLMNDTYMTGLEKSVWWIEYVIRNNGTKELRNPAAKLPFYQYYALDVLGFIFSIAIVMVLVLRRIVMVLLVVTRRVIGRKLKKL